MKAEISGVFAIMIDKQLFRYVRLIESKDNRFRMVHSHVWETRCLGCMKPVEFVTSEVFKNPVRRCEACQEAFKASPKKYKRVLRIS